MLTLITLVASGLLTGGQEVSLPDSDQRFLRTIESVRRIQSPQFHRFTRVDAVSNDGSIILIRIGSAIGGVNLADNYVLETEYPMRLAFRADGRRLASELYSFNGIVGGLEGGFAIASLQPGAQARFNEASNTWVVFPVDRRNRDVPSNLLTFAKPVYPVSANFGKGDLLYVCVAEDSYPAERVQLVDYVFGLRFGGSQPTVRAGVLSRRQTSRYYLHLREPRGRLIRTFGATPGWVSSDRKSAVFSGGLQTVASLETGTNRLVAAGDHATSATMMNIGNTLVRTVVPVSAAATLVDTKGAGSWMWSGKSWMKATSLVITQLSLNGKFGVLMRLPESVGGSTEWYLVRFRF